MPTKFKMILLIIISLMAMTLSTAVSATFSAQSDGNNQLNSFTVTYGGRVTDGNQTTFTYIVTGNGSPPDLSHFDVGIPTCDIELEVIAYSPTDAVVFGIDPTSGVDGIKWDLPLPSTASRTYTITFAGNVDEGSVTVAVKDGDGAHTTMLPGPTCRITRVNVEKFVSIDGGTSWDSADAAPGPEVELGAPVSFRFVVTNTGTTELVSLALTDSIYDLSGCTFPGSLAPEAFLDCTVGPYDAEEGQHTNIATVTASFEGQTVQDTDSANYFGGDRPSIKVEKFVLVDGSWQDADSTPGPEVEIGSDVSFRFVVTNDGNVPVTGVNLGDSVYDTDSCSFPDTLNPGDSVECTIGPFPAEEGQHSNIATVTASFNGTSIMASDSGNYYGDETEEDATALPITIVIEGPVEAINDNIILIFGFDVEVNPDDPVLTDIQIGDNIRIEGDTTVNDGIIVIVAVNITIIDIDIVVGSPGGSSGGGSSARSGRSGCKLTGFGNGNIRCKGSNRGS